MLLGEEGESQQSRQAVCLRAAGKGLTQGPKCTAKGVEMKSP